jgi:dihydrofolate synthase/folylpolyglutamate synthase
MENLIWPDNTKMHHINLGLDRIYSILARLGNPHQHLPPTIHVAGTNGKGSTIAFLKSIYEEAGYLVHRYTSPHLVEFNERIELAGNIIDDEFLTKILDECKLACETSPKIDATYFEATTACAFLAFSKVKADILLLETGMGGMHDATNVLSSVFQSIITPIDFDHQQYLGSEIQEIASAKAGIIKENCPTIIAQQNPKAFEVISKKCLSSNSDLIIANNYLENINFNTQNLKTSLIGSHQIQNAITAIASVKYQNIFNISDDNIHKALKNTSWNARLQKISTGKFLEKIDNNFEVFLDGSHNIQGSNTLLEFLNNHKTYNKILIFQMMNDKDSDQFLKTISKEIDKLFIFEKPQNSNFKNHFEIQNICNKYAIKSEFTPDFSYAFQKIHDQFFGQKTLILVAGSLYFAGNFLKQNNHKS